ncbi:thymidylate kinase isoform X2 [Cimex lectularius]|nr:thymidylate kinase isoform X3 [Cimex lectularius]XP_024082009.1 thymidylate kinase isoform X2 [Cimex lectularius]
MARGAFIVIEGCDRSGKSTQCKLLVQGLNNSGIKAKNISFPDRSTEIGKVIDSYLTKKIELPDQAIHLLFSANRWELNDMMKQQLEDGTTLVVDRYSYSGVAYSASKSTHNMDIEWFKAPEMGLLKPDAVFFLHLDNDVAKQRNGFGKERYENKDIQNRVAKFFKSFEKFDEWQVIDANKTVDQLRDQLMTLAKNLIEEKKSKSLNVL